MSYIRVKVIPSSVIPENALLFYDAGTGDYYFLTDNNGNYLTWSSV